jgi:hypothetical protein
VVVPKVQVHGILDGLRGGG